VQYQEEKAIAELDKEDEELIKSITFRVILYLCIAMSISAIMHNMCMEGVTF